METIRLDDHYVLFIVSRYPTTTHLPLVSDVLSLLSYLFWWDLMTFDEENLAKESLQAICICICISYIANKTMENIPSVTDTSSPCIDQLQPNHPREKGQSNKTKVWRLQAHSLILNGL